MSQHERKRLVTLESFRKLAMFSFQSEYEESQYLTNTLFIIFGWNLICITILLGLEMHL